MRVDDPDVVPALVQAKFVDHDRMEETDQIRTGTHREGRIREGLLQGAGSAQSFGALQYEDLDPLTGKISGGGQSVVPTSHHHDVPSTGAEVVYWSRQPDSTEDVVDSSHLGAASYRSRRDRRRSARRFPPVWHVGQY